MRKFNLINSLINSAWILIFYMILIFYRLDEYPYYVEREWWKHGNRMTFWSTWRMKRDVKRRHLLAELGPDRVRLKALKSNIILPEMIRDECAKKLHNFPKGSCPNLVQHLCQFSGARRGKLNRFHLHRQIFRHLFHIVYKQPLVLPISPIISISVLNNTISSMRNTWN